jgi:hypothetical protein
MVTCQAKVPEAVKVFKRFTKFEKDSRWAIYSLQVEVDYTVAFWFLFLHKAYQVHQGAILEVGIVRKGDAVETAWL